MLDATRPSKGKTFAALLLCIFWLMPFVPLLLWAVAKSWFPPDLVPQGFSLRGFYALVQGGAKDALVESLIIGSGVAFLSLLIALPAGRALGLSQHKSVPLLQTLLMLPALVPQMAVALGLHTRFLTLGLADSKIGVLLAHLIVALPYAIIVLSSSFSQYDPRYEEAALNLGASKVRVFLTITLKQIAPALLTAALFAFIISWSQYTLTLIIGGGVVITLPVLLYSLSSGGDLHLVAATCIAFIAPVLLLTPLTSRALTGNTLGGRG